jgi:hypothetical protein
MKWLKQAWEAFWLWIDWHGRLTTLIALIVAGGGATLVGKVTSILVNVNGVYLYVVVALAFAAFLGTTAIVGRKMEARPKTVLANNAEPPLAVKGESNITWTSIFVQKLVREREYLRPFAPNESSDKMFAFMIQIANPAVQGKRVASAGLIKAQLHFKLKQGEYDISPGAWLNEQFGSVHLDVGDQKSLILAVSDSYVNDWKMIANRRTSAAAPVALDYSRDVPTRAEGSLEIDLIAAESGNILRTYSMKMRWMPMYSLDFYGMQ